MTYGGLLQARQVGHQIGTILEQARADEQPRRDGGASSPKSKPKRKRFRIIVHTSPFLRCIQTSIGLSSGLAQSTPDFSLDPFDLVVPPIGPGARDDETKSTVLRVDSFLGEWLSPEYFEMITPPPSSSLMLGTAKADLLKREDHTKHTHLSKEPFVPQAPPDPKTMGGLWNASPTHSPSPGGSRQSPAPEAENKSFNTSALASALQGHAGPKRGYIQPRPNHAVSSAGKIPDGVVADARDKCVVVDYQWDSMREPLAFGDGGTFGEEWSSMHKRFRGGLEKMVNWYWDNPQPTDLVSQPSPMVDEDEDAEAEEEIENVVVIVSHGAGCNAIIGAITHQPVLMDVGLASITMASRKPGIEARQTTSMNEPARVDSVYDIRLSASTEHLQSTHSTPVSARRASGNGSPSTNGASVAGPRGRTSTFSNVGGAIMNQFTFNDPLSSHGSRSSSASAAVGLPGGLRRESAPGPTTRIPGRGSALSSIAYGAIAGNESGKTGGAPPPSNNTVSSGSSSSQGLWTAQPSSLRMMDDGKDDSDDDFGDMLPSLDQSKFMSASVSPPSVPASLLSRPLATSPPAPAPVNFHEPGRGPVLAGPIKLNTHFEEDEKHHVPEPVSLEQLGGGAGGLWGVPPPPDEAEVFRDRTQTKRRWTVNERG